MREQLELLASKTTTLRMDNLRKNKGLPASDTANLLIDPQTFNEELKAAKDLSAAFTPSRSTSSSSSNLGRRGRSGKQDHKQQQPCKYDLERSMRHYVDNRMYQSHRRLSITGVAALGNESFGTGAPGREPA